MKPFKINLQLLHLVAAIFQRDPLAMLVDCALWQRSHIERAITRLRRLQGVMPETTFEQVVTFMEELFTHRGGPFQFIYTDRPDVIDPAIAKWTALMRRDIGWLEYTTLAPDGDSAQPTTTVGSAAARAASGSPVESTPGTHHAPEPALTGDQAQQQGRDQTPRNT